MFIIIIFFNFWLLFDWNMFLFMFFVLTGHHHNFLDFELHTLIHSFLLQQTVKGKELKLVDSVWMFVVYIVLLCLLFSHPLPPSLPPRPGSGTPAVKASTVGLRDPQLCSLHPLMNNKTHSWIIDADFCTQSAGAIIQMCDGSGLGLTDQMDPPSAAPLPAVMTER